MLRNDVQLEVDRITAELLSADARPVSGEPWDNHTIDELPMTCCFYCGECRTKLLMVTKIRFWGPAYQCRSHSLCRKRKNQGHGCLW